MFSSPKTMFLHPKTYVLGLKKRCFYELETIDFS